MNNMMSFYSLFEMILLVIGVEWIVVFIMMKSGIAYKFLPKPNEKDYSVEFTNNGWNLHIPSQNPLDFIDMIIKKLTGEDASTEEYIQQNIKNIIKSKSKIMIEKTLEKSDIVNKKVAELVLASINAEILNKKK